ncbi:zinc finger E-box-binding homeobox 2-like [Acipenser oxyrinchus oxyrinchus]|uniref:Zinc finger E-box-binding homeobox 2-like n=1 Tax=Acipenser oxyrinchus oxyrinchus TaxID=40147 RepID=A0AAD8FNR4_ACIOX|nr:zinc finger E-box-binding homeobox 2-like [Acipenser oxyrinchus oxyrinchus]
MLKNTAVLSTRRFPITEPFVFFLLSAVTFDKLPALGSEGEDEETQSVMEEKDSQDPGSFNPIDGGEPVSPSEYPRTRSLSSEPSAGEQEQDWPEKDEHMTRQLHGPCEDQALESELEGLYYLKGLERDSLSPASLPGCLQQNGTPIIYPEAPEDEPLPCRTPVRDISEGKEAAPWTPESLCPYCNRGYRRDGSLREHIRFCHKREDSSLVCSLCGYSASYHAQMERHMELHSQAQSQHPGLEQPTENRKFKCSQCGKAFKYKHHLKEHLRIHSGEKPYECSNCKKRFSHSGSYSSHLSSKKCLSGGSTNGGAYGGLTASLSPKSPSLPLSLTPTGGAKRGLKESLSDPSYPFRIQDRSLDYKHVEDSPKDNADLLMSRDMGLEIPTLQKLPHCAPLLSFLNPGREYEHMVSAMLQGSGYGQSADFTSSRGMEKVLQECREQMHKEKPEPNRKPSDPDEPQLSVITCRWCFQPFPNRAVLYQHEKYLCKINREAFEGPRESREKEDSHALNFSIKSNLVQDSQNGFNSTIVVNGSSEDPKRLPHRQFPSRISSPNVPRPNLLCFQAESSLENSTSTSTPMKELWNPDPLQRLAGGSPSYLEKRRSAAIYEEASCLDLSTCPPQKKGRPARERPPSRGPQMEPLDLSLPKPREEASEGSDTNGSTNSMSPITEKDRTVSPGQRTPILQPHSFGVNSLYRNSVYSAFPFINSMLPGGLVNTGHEGLPGVGLNPAVAGMTFLPPMAYMFEADPEALLKRIHQERQAAMGEVLNRGCLDYLSLLEDGIDVDCGPGRKRLRKTEDGLYACDLCDKTFQKSSSLLRHKYEHTGKRPHQCKICKKAFKHKHHLIEHSRLHSGEKPYQCDKCGKRFSHSGSYSQHMNHRYAYCRKDLDPNLEGAELRQEPTPTDESSYTEDGDFRSEDWEGNGHNLEHDEPAGVVDNHEGGGDDEEDIPTDNTDADRRLDHNVKDPTEVQGNTAEITE